MLFYLSHGYYFDLGLWGNRRVYLLRKAIQSTEEFAVNPAFIAAAVALIGAFVAKSKPICTNRYVIALIISLGFAGLLSGGEGAATNYFLESAGLVCILLGIYGVSALAIDRANGHRTMGGRFRGDCRREREHRGLCSGRKSPRPDDGEESSGYRVRTGGSAVYRAGHLGRINAGGERSVLLRRGCQEPSGGRQPTGRGYEGRPGERVVLAKPLEQDAPTDNKWPAEIMEVMRSHYAPAGRADAGYLYLYVQRPVRVRD